MAIKRRHLRLVKDQIKPEEVSLDTSNFEAIPDEDELDLLLDEVSDEEFGVVETKDVKPVKLKEWKAEEFASIYVRFRPHLERHARKWLNNQSQVDEVVQDAFLYLMVSLPELDSEIGVLKFMKWKVKNLCLDIYRASGKAYVKSIDDVAEPIALNSELGSDIERAEDAAIVRLALSKLNPRHREVLLASIYEEKSIEEIALQINLSENATRQLSFRARAAFKKALLGETDTEGMSISEILSVAARKAAEEAKKVGVKALVFIVFLAVSFGSLFSSGTGPDSTSQVAQTPTQLPTQPEKVDPPAVTNFVDSSEDFVREVPEVPDLLEFNNVSAASAENVVTSNQSANVIIYPASKSNPSLYRVEGPGGIYATFELDPTSGNAAKNIVFELTIDGITYTAYSLNLQTQTIGSERYLTGQLTDLIDLQGLLYRGNQLSFANFLLYFDLLDMANSGKFTLFKKS